MVPRSFALTTRGICLVAVIIGLWGNGTARAAGISFGGDKPDNQWRITIQYCRNGLTLHAWQTHLSTMALPFSLRLASSSIPVKASLPRVIAGGNGSTIAAHRAVAGTLVVRFRRVHPAGTPIRIAIARLDRGLKHPAASDDTLHLRGTLRRCTIHG